MLVGVLAALGVACQRLPQGGVLVNGRTVGASALRQVSVVDAMGASRTVDELLGQKGVLCYLRHLG